jgi:hypothetical protein
LYGLVFSATTMLICFLWLETAFRTKRINSTRQQLRRSTIIGSIAYGILLVRTWQDDCHHHACWILMITRISMIGSGRLTTTSALVG